MADALIGYTGFVGGNLLRQRRFDAVYNSKNVEEIRGQTFDVAICSAAPAEKWRANEDPARDREVIGRLRENLAHASARKWVLISTVDVYARPIGVDEDSDVEAAAATAYGRHRYELERFMTERFDTLVVRLPALYGEGLKKNVIYDLLHRHRLEALNSEGVFQFYGLANLWRDVERALAAGLTLVNFATEPVSVKDVARHAFDLDFDQPLPGAASQYDFRSKHAPVFGGVRGYLYGRDQVLTGIRRFVAAQRQVPR